MNILLIIIFCLTGISVILTISNWLYLISISAKANDLEQEINKKTREFDNFKKERSSIHRPEHIIPVPEIPSQESSVPVMSDKPIQIMRNVGGAFEEANRPETFVSKHNHIASENSGNNNPHYLSLNNDDTFIKEFQPDMIPIKTNQTTEQDMDILATVSESESRPDNYLILQLYSESAKDADFENLWKNISSLLKTVYPKDIGIDFSSINFLYDKEIAYLIKIHQIAASSGKKIHFVNCDQELAAILNKNPQLKQLIKKKVI